MSDIDIEIGDYVDPKDEYEGGIPLKVTRIEEEKYEDRHIVYVGLEPDELAYDYPDKYKNTAPDRLKYKEKKPYDDEYTIYLDKK